MNTCRFCKEQTDDSHLVKYGVRHYAHAKCGLEAKGVAFLDDLTDWQCTQFPYYAAVKAGAGIAAELALRCERYRVTEKARARESV
jgi:hypothetical protein